VRRGQGLVFVSAALGQSSKQKQRCKQGRAQRVKAEASCGFSVIGFCQQD
jgi:hypothetical protein